MARLAPRVDDAPELAKLTGTSIGRAKETRNLKLEAEQHKDLAARQRAARFARSHTDELGMVHMHLALEPHMGTPIVSRAEAEAQRLARAAKKQGQQEPFERYLADAYAALMTGSGKGRSKRPELVVLVSQGRQEGLEGRQERRGLQDPRGGAGLAGGLYHEKTERDRRAGKLRAKSADP